MPQTLNQGMCLRNSAIKVSKLITGDTLTYCWHKGAINLAHGEVSMVSLLEWIVVISWLSLKHEPKSDKMIFLWAPILVCDVEKYYQNNTAKAKGQYLRKYKGWIQTSNSVFSSFRFNAAFTHCLASKLSSENFEKSIVIVIEIWYIWETAVEEYISLISHSSPLSVKPWPYV